MPETPELLEDASDLQDPFVVQITHTPPEAQTRTRSLGPAAPPSGPRFCWCLDNGHGRLQAGKRSPAFADGSRLFEWELARDIVRRMMPALDQAGVQYVQIVPEEDVDAFLKERVTRANDFASPLGLPKLFVSIHANAASNETWHPSASGLETWHYPGSQAGRRLASAFQRHLVEKLGWNDRGIRSHQPGSRQVFYVLNNTTMTAVLTENGFYTHEAECTLLMKPEVRQLIADAHVAAILEVEAAGLEAIPLHPVQMTVG
jgi:N-acetylmuramoyl-L-alanine amidase